LADRIAESAQVAGYGARASGRSLFLLCVGNFIAAGGTN
jgi:hypothetical protein